MQKKILITGATGFVGSHLVEYLLKNTKYEVFGTYFSEDSLSILGKNLEKIKTFKVDLTQEDDVDKLMSQVQPDEVYHLAAFTSPAQSFESPKEVILNNISSELNLLEELRKHNLKNTKILITSSAEVYGTVKKEDLPISEEVSLNPTSPYAVSKVAQDFLGKQYFLSYGLKIIRVRPFNHIGPRQSPNFVVASFSKKIAEIEKGKHEPVLTVGNLDSKRDFTDVRDVVRAYSLLMEKGKFGEVYNIGSGKSYKISQILDMLLKLTKIKIKIEIDKNLLRPSDNPELVCDFTKLRSITGWEPSVAIEETLKETLDYWRGII